MATTRTGPDVGAGIGARTPYLMLALATLGLRGQLLGVGADQPARPDVPGPGHAR